MFKSYAPQSEWDILAEVLGQNLINNAELRASFSSYLERPQKDLIDLISKIQNTYANVSADKSNKDIFLICQNYIF